MFDAPPSHRDPQPTIAIVGMAGRFPGAPDVDRFWQLLLAGGDAIRPVPAERWDASERAVQAVGGFLDGVDEFDPAFFGISPREAADLDPQHRLMLEVTWQALEDTGQPAAALRGSRTGVYVGASWHDYELVRKERGAPASAHSGVGSALDVIAGRVSYFLGLRGPSLTVETGCSSSLVALHLACQALRGGEIDGALVGGVNLLLAPDVSVALTQFGGLSPDGRCKAFAAGANGFVRGEGVIAVYVKTLARAIADGDRIHGVIVGTAVNNDGGGASLVTPSPAGQEDLLRHAYAAAGVIADDLAYVEAHGTGTAVGDPIEAGALGRALGQRRDRARGPLAIGSVKTNIGHLEAAAGLAGLVKTVLALAHRVVPASLHAEELNPAIAFDALHLQVARAPLALPATGTLYAGVNSFGWAGTNAHVIVASAPAAVAREATARRGPLVVPLSAHSDEALRQRARDVQAVAARGEVALEALAATLACRRDHHARRAGFVVDTIGELADMLAGFADQPDGPRVAHGSARDRGRVAFVVPGQGGQWPAMGRALFASEPVFARAIARCAAALAPHIDWDLIACLTGDAGDAWLDRVDVVQPVLWAVSVALAELWRAAGIEPDVVIGHSQGEIAAATIAGALSDADAARLVARRAAILRRVTSPGLMLAIDLDEPGARAALAGFEDRVALAAVNGPRSCVLSGDAEAIATLQELLEAEGAFCRRVQVDYASHSHHMDALAPALSEALAGLAPRASRIALMSTLTAAPIAGDELDAAYWIANLRQPVRFAEAMRQLLADGVSHVIEISPHPVLAPAIEQLAAAHAAPARVLSSLHRSAGSAHDFARAMARAFVAGLAPFAALASAPAIPLPSYPWQRKKYWVATPPRRGQPGPRTLALLPDADEPGHWRAALELALGEQPWLADHKVGDAVVVPATAILALALDAGHAHTGALPRRLVDVRLVRALAVGDEPTRLEVGWRDDGAARARFTMRSLAAGATAWTEHASARIEDAAGSAPPVFPRALLAAPVSTAEAFYTACTARGLAYGPALRGVTRVYVDGDAALGEVRLPDACAPGAHRLHPALWDAALQVCLALVGGEHTVVPTAIARLDVLADLAAPRALWAHAVRRASERVDVTLFTADEQPVMTIEGLRLQRLAGTDEGDDGARLHHLRFQPEARGPVVAGRWLVCGELRDGAQALVDALGDAGRLATSASSLRDASRVVFVAPRASAGLAVQRQRLLALTALIRTCAACATPPRVVVVTADAQPALDDDQPDPGAALYLGFVRVAGREHPELAPRSIDVRACDPAWAADCAAELRAGAGDDQVALRAGHRLVGRLVRGHVRDEPRAGWAASSQPFRVHVATAGRGDGVAFAPLRRRAPAAGEIEIEVRAAALNFIDVMKLMGTYPDATGTRLGGECAGRVIAVGAGVRALAIGDRVVACGFGSMASHLTVRADHARRIPAAIADVDAAGLPLVLATAWYALHDLARLAAGETVLIHAAAGGLGLAAIQVARMLGARVLATAGSEVKRRYVRALGIADVFDSRDLSWVDGVRAATAGRGVDVVLNSLTGAAIPLGLEVLAEDGRFLEVGKRDIHAGRHLSLAAFKKGISFAAVDLAGLIERRPERFARVLATAWAQVESGAIAPLPTTAYAFPDAADALTTMARGEHIGKLVLTATDGAHPIAPEAFADGRLRGDATYLITGGLGALGLSLAEMFADHGAGALVLAGRSAPSPEAARRIAALSARGVRVETLALDVGDRAAVARALVHVRQTMPALRGVVHAAGLLDDATIGQLTAAQLARVLAPKIDGARHLDAATAGDPLDLFVLFSSAAALVGNAGQAAYAAGNAYLDALAVRRRRQGRPALSVQWGPFADVGLAACDARRGARLAERGMGAISTGEAWRALTAMLAADQPVVGYVALDLRHWFDAYPETAAQSSWHTLRHAMRPGGGSSSSGSGDGFRSQLAGSPAPTRRELAETKVCELTSRVLRLDPTTIDGATPFKALGLDSLMGLELRNRLETAFGLQLSPTLLWTYGNPRALADVLCERVLAAPAG